MDSDRTIPPPRIPDHDRNENTCFAVDIKPRVPRSALADAYDLARARMVGVPSAGAGFRLFWVRGRDVGWMDLPRRDACAVIGRHTQCDVVLDASPDISLRHLLAATLELADGPALRLLDLRTSIPFYLDDDTPRSSIVAAGLVVVRFCGYVLGAVPLEADEGQPGKPVLPAALPKTHVSNEDLLPRSVRPPTTREPMWVDLEDSISHVTSMPPPSLITELPRRSTRAVSAASAAHARGPASRSGDVCASITLRSEGRSASVELTQGELEVGVLVGRSDRCHDRGLQAVLDTSISRGHVLLLSRHDGFEAFDLCSTQGTYVQGKKVRRVGLADPGTTLTLATTRPVTLEWERVS